ncbi:type IV pilin N-terminal domain-containing protein [Halobacteria archaeon AArc-m2/3/4]|uniref:Type IV pilin N-terminal domain-containing protein n=1 Tax=Natronoglomus mannanivorans TaxID=2979990 RepID=A0ABT2QDD3_9EURY|nr:type IV pilin N-terminal domain-containing protein [Halobacteria archaeon AArc-m2/3/4]
MKIFAKLIGDDDERAVSPVIGVILMVAITVILAAVIAAFVLDLGQSQSASASAGVTFSEDGNEVTPQLISIDNADSVYVRITDDDDSYWVNPDGEIHNDKEDDWSVGDSVTMNSNEPHSSGDLVDSGDIDPDADLDGIDRITVIGELDGSDTVIQIWD